MSDWIKTTLRPNQEAAVAAALPYTRFVVSTGTGSGKTLTSLSMFARLKADNPRMMMVVLTPKSAAIGTWPDQIKEHTTFSCRVNSISHENDVNVLSYSQLNNQLALLGDLCRAYPVFLVLDEAHKIKSEESKLAVFLRQIMHVFPRVLALTATTMMNHLEDVFWLYEGLFPGIFGGDLDMFMNTYANRVLREFGTRQVFEVTGFKNLEHLAERIKPFTYSDTVEVKVDFDFHTIKPTQQEEDAYLRAAAQVLEEAKSNDASFAAKLPFLQAVVNNSDPEFPLYTLGLTSKEQALLEYLKGVAERNEAVIVFSFFRQSITRVEEVVRGSKLFENVYVITGKATDTVRKELVSSFRQGDCLIASAVAAESLNLQESNNVLFYDLAWSVGTFIQAVGRIARMNSRHESKRVVVLSVDGTIDMYKTLLLQSNMSTVMQVSGSFGQYKPMKSEVKRDLIIRMRKELLWRTGRRSKSVNLVAGEVSFSKTVGG